MIDQVLHRAVLVNKIRVQRADHVGTDRADYTVEDIPVAAHPRGLARLGPCTVGVVVTSYDVNMGLTSLATDGGSPNADHKTADRTGRRYGCRHRAARSRS